ALLPACRSYQLSQQIALVVLARRREVDRLEALANHWGTSSCSTSCLAPLSILAPLPVGGSLPAPAGDVRRDSRSQLLFQDIERPQGHDPGWRILPHHRLVLGRRRPCLFGWPVRRCEGRTMP